ncbi:TPA: hypothetical protein N0F65_008954 [Lagenidium giganteum]|uniref:Uncharacterized protein n=1 Tax=Lagenidium giganteum TaxID=4803 RepID=A0AAV2YY84_9STRA|nr:TPA: hypothetical protein N0F65_008954 [Lagenidium giganteum]
MTKKPTVTVDPPPPVPVARIAAPNAAPKAASNATPNALPSSALSAVASNAAPIASPAASPTRSAATTPENETAGAPHKRIKRCNPAMVVFTMDGTLVDFNSLWGGWVESQAFRLEVAAKLARAKFFQAFGYDYQNRCLFRGSLLTMMPKQQLSKVAVELLVTECWTLPDLASTCQPLCDLVALFKTLNHLDIRIAICTTDTRANTVAALQKLRVDRHVDAIACSDDGFPPKPSPQLIWALCRQLNASAQNTVLVGSTATDMALGHNSGCGLSIGFLGGGVSRIEDLSVAADVLVGSLDKIVKVLFQYTQQALRTEQ